MGGSAFGFVVAATVALAAPAAAGNRMAASGCLDVRSSDTPVTLTGTLSRQVFPGSPNYESIAEGDEAEAAVIMTLEEPICVDDGGEFADPSDRFKDVQIGAADDAVQTLLIKNLGREVGVSGEGFPAHTGHHHAPLVILADTVKVK